MTRADDLRRMLDNGRHPGESFRAYRKRRAFGNTSVKQALKGRMAWASPGGKGSTYRQPEPKTPSKRDQQRSRASTR